MVVHDLNSARARRGPHETYPPLAIDPDTVLTGLSSLARLQLAAGRHLKLASLGRHDFH